ncbi:hypothetical protein [Archaeoglobus sp.]
MKDSLKLYQHSEKLKSELIIGMKLVKSLESLKDKEFDGGLKVVSEFFSALRVEVGIAYNSTGDERFRQVYDIVSNVDFVDVDSAIETLSKAMTIITNCAVDSYESMQKCDDK